MAPATKDVPWSVAWSGEQAFRLQPSADFPGMVELDQKQDIGAGEPLFATINVTRQRRGLADLLCHVCGKATDPHDRYIFPTASGGLVTLHDGTEQYGCNVPPMHRACAVRARHACRKIPWTWKWIARRHIYLDRSKRKCNVRRVVSGGLAR